MNTDPAAIVPQLVIGSCLLASVWIAWDHPRIRTPWALLSLGHAGLLCYFSITGQWGFWPMNIGFITVGIIRWTQAQALRTKAGRSVSID